MHTESFEMLTFSCGYRETDRETDREACGFGFVFFRFRFQNRPKPTEILVKKRKTDRVIFHFRFTTLSTAIDLALLLSTNFFFDTPRFFISLFLIEIRVYL